MYKNEVDISTPLNDLKYEFNNITETNSVLFEYAIEINKIVNDYNFCGKIDIDKIVLQEMGPILAEELNKIKNLQAELVNISNNIIFMMLHVFYNMLYYNSIGIESKNNQNI